MDTSFNTLFSVGNITLGKYGEYRSENYGSNAMVLSLGGLMLYISYSTVIAIYTSALGLVVRQNDWSKTMGKHRNWIDGGWIDGGDKKNRLPFLTFEQILHDTLKRNGLEGLEDGKHGHEWVKTDAQEGGEGWRCEVCDVFLERATGQIK